MTWNVTISEQFIVL